MNDSSQLTDGKQYGANFLVIYLRERPQSMLRVKLKILVGETLMFAKILVLRGKFGISNNLGKVFGQHKASIFDFCLFDFFRYTQSGRPNFFYLLENFLLRQRPKGENDRTETLVFVFLKVFCIHGGDFTFLLSNVDP